MLTQDWVRALDGSGGMGRAGDQLDSARRLAGRLNFLPIAAFGLWSIPAKLFWLIALGIVPWFHPAPPLHSALPWFDGALLSGPPAFLLPRSFHEPRVWEYRGTFYRRMGIERFRSIVANGDLVNRFVRARHGSGYSVYGADIERLIPKSIFNERRHIAYLCWGMASACYAWSIGWSGWACWLAVTNVGANLYPTMLQRYSRARVMRLAAAAQRRRPRESAIGAAFANEGAVG
jgi:hypothetical protein